MGNDENSRSGCYPRSPRTGYCRTLVTSSSTSTRILPRRTSNHSTATSNVSTDSRIGDILARHPRFPQDILDFICRFPHLDDLTLKMSISATPSNCRSDTLPAIKRMPPFRGRLKLSGTTEWRGHLLYQLISLPGRRRFRSIGFRSCESGAEQPIVDACCDTLESFSIAWKRYGRCRSIL